MIEEKDLGPKELWRGRNVSIGVYERGFTVDDLTVAPEINAITGKPNKNVGQEKAVNRTYHSRLAAALTNAAGRVAKREAATLQEYLDAYAGMVRELVDATKGV